MNRFQSFTIGLIALGAIAGSTMTSFAQNNFSQTTPVSQKVAQGSPQKAQANAGSAFSPFRQRLLNAVQRSDAKFIRAIVTPQTQWNYGGTLNLNSYKIDSNQSKFWPHMEKAVSQGCGIDSQARVGNKEAGSSVWVCPDLTKVKQSVRPNRPNFGNLAVVGQNVNLRAEPGMGGKVIGSVSNQYVSFDTEAFNKLSAARQKAVQPVSGWSPVRVQNGQRGWIENRFLHDEENDYRTSFVRSGGQWRLRYFLPGNGN